MSVEATNWAWTRPVNSGNHRLVLLSLADRAGENHTCWPSMERLATDTVLNIKTVKKVVNELIEQGLVRDTGKRFGSTGRVRVLQLVGVPSRESAQKRVDSNHTNIGTVNNFNEPKNGFVKQDQKRVDCNGVMNPILDSNEPNIGSQNLKENLSMNLSCEHGWIPNQDQLISVLKQAGQELNLKLIFELPSFEFELGAFNAHHDGRVIGEGKKLYSFATWIVDKFQRYAKQHPEYLNPVEQQNPTQNTYNLDQPVFKGVAKTFKGMNQ